MVGILIDPVGGDLLVESGAMQLGDNTGCVAEAVLRANRGEFKEYPLLGAEVVKVLGGEASLLWRQQAQQMLVAAGVPAERVMVDSDGITVL